MHEHQPPAQAPTVTRTRIFVSYSHVDRAWLDMLATHIAVLQRHGLIELWSDTRVEAGAPWRQEIDAALASAKVAVLLVSPAFLASSFIWEEEMPRIVAHARDGMAVLPLIARPCAWKLEPDLAKLQARPADGRPLSAGSESQVDQDLSALAYELAARVGRSPAASTVREPLAGAESREGASVTGPGVVGAWTGFYNKARPVRLVVGGTDDQVFRGTLEYPRERTITRVEGSVLGNVSAADPLWSQLGIPPLPPAASALMFRETGYEQGSQGTVSFDGEYRAVVHHDDLIGAWFSGGRLIGTLALQRTA